MKVCLKLNFHGFTSSPHVSFAEIFLSTTSCLEIMRRKEQKVGFAVAIFDFAFSFILRQSSL